MRTKLRSLFLTCCAAAMLLTAVPGTSNGTANAAAQTTTKPVTIMLDGFPLPFPSAPFNSAGTIMVPFRAIAQAMNIHVDWSNDTHTLTATKTQGGVTTEVILRQSQLTATVNGQKKQLNKAPVNQNGTFFVPLSFFSTQFGAQVSWDGPSQTVTITSPIEPMYTETFYAIRSFFQLNLVEKFDSVSFGWIRIDPTSGELTLDGDDFYWPDAAGDISPDTIVNDTTTQGSEANLMAVAMDGKGELTKLLSDSEQQANVIDELVETALIHHFTGITLDFEGLGLTGDRTAVQQTFNSFVQKLDQKAEASNLTLTLALHPLNSSYHGYDYKTLSSYADEIIIMAYDYKPYVDAPEPITLVNEAIELALKEVPKSKLVLGISADSETDQSIGSKIGLAKRYGLKGVAIWRLGLISEKMMTAIEKSITPIH
ncbi:spore germination protein YaaH [Paenibacillus cellulosilyticus]|uniref:Spore germination protein YaaH n=1 Tax=Paenibacillus cellulosilyticus TaxID=375489 RepID=A0A2V2YYH2_9BACL|nr:stalk domain-containing protein [Paenibacillus cellulosilyticus]PWV98017.1 spore germination protein YaaH [Paenibacillus cellulosilyticus]QKS43961.1 glycosyl hydrolase [Paenibacillus cellulosilyticus]